MSRIANIIRGLFGRKPVHQQKDSMAPRGNGEKSVQPMPENVIPVSYTHLDVYKRQTSCRVINLNGIFLLYENCFTLSLSCAKMYETDFYEYWRQLR